MKPTTEQMRVLQEIRPYVAEAVRDGYDMEQAIVRGLERHRNLCREMLLQNTERSQRAMRIMRAQAFAACHLAEEVKASS